MQLNCEPASCSVMVTVKLFCLAWCFPTDSLSCFGICSFPCNHYVWLKSRGEKYVWFGSPPESSHKLRMNYAARNLCSSRHPPQQDKQSLWAWKGGREEADGSRRKLPPIWASFPLCLLVKTLLLTEVFQQLMEATARAVWVYQSIDKFRGCITVVKFHSTVW